MIVIKPTPAANLLSIVMVRIRGSHFWFAAVSLQACQILRLPGHTPRFANNENVALFRFAVVRVTSQSLSAPLHSVSKSRYLLR